MMSFRFGTMRCLAPILASVLLAAASALAAESARLTVPGTTVTLVSDQDGWAPGARLRLGLHFQMQPGWHIYWRNPGDAGIAPDFAFTLPDGVAVSAIDWPVPERFVDGPLVTYGYQGDVLLQVTATLPASLRGTLPVALKATWLICHPVCVPEEGSFRLDLPAADPASPSADSPLFEAAARAAPRPSPFIAHVSPDGVLSVAGDGLDGDTVRAASFYADREDTIAAAPDQVLSTRTGGFDLALQPGPAFKPGASLTGVLVLTDGHGQRSALQIDAAPGPAVMVGHAATAGNAFGLNLIYALLGGLILNLMPCVFPVLALKAFSLVRLGGADRTALRLSAGAYALGTILAFMGLGGLLVGLRAAGDSVGWGFQFQSPVFVALTAWLIFLVGLNLAGVFDVTIQPGATLAARFDGRKLGGSFMTGVLAVVVASPCTAPFMGAALAAALALPLPQTMAIFMALGIGLALPSLALAAVPSWGRFMPRPGVWMDILKQALAFPMFGATAWLLWVASRQSGSDGVLVIAVGLVLLATGAWALGRGAQATGAGRWLGRGVAVAALVGAALLLVEAPEGAAQSTTASAADGIEPFSAERLAALRTEGRPVFVDMTAAWCVTCLVNERLALAPAAVRTSFDRHHVAYLKGDWTRGDPAITRFLRTYNADGVPLYLLFRPGVDQPVVLPQVLTEGLILGELADLKS